MNKLTLLVIGSLLFVLTACSAAEAPNVGNGIAGSGSQPEAEAVPIEAQAAAPAEAEVEAAAPVEEEAAAPFRASACPSPSSDTRLFSSPENGFCFLYPADFVPAAYFESPDNGVTIGEAADGFSFINLTVAYKGPTDQADAEEYYEDWNAQLNAGALEPLSIPEVDKADINQYEAVVAYGLPAGMGQSRRAFLVANGSRYSIEMTPDADPEFMEDDVIELWDTVTESVVLFGADPDKEYLLPEDVCPEEEPNTTLLINEAEGFCYLYPFNYQISDLFPGGVEGGPVLDRSDSAGEVRNRIVVSRTGPAGGNTAAEVLEPRLTVIDAGSVDEMDADYDGVVFLDERGPYQSRQAIVVANETQYTIVQQPYDPLAFPDAADDFEDLWDLVTESIAFFEPLL